MEWRTGERKGARALAILNPGPDVRRYLLSILGLWAAILACASAAQVPLGAPGGEQRIAARLVAEQPVAPGGSVAVAFDFRPDPGWHGYWTNPGDAGLGMTLDWDLPPGWSMSEPTYPVPGTLLISGLMNHVYERPYGVLVTLTAPRDAVPGSTAAISVRANWLACSDRLCVPESARLDTTILVATRGKWAPDPRMVERFDEWRRALPAPLDSAARFEARGDLLRIAVPLPDDVIVEQPHLFIAQKGVANPAAEQRIRRQEGALVFEVARPADASALPPAFDAVLRLDAAGNGLAFRVEPGAVAVGGRPLGGAADGLSYGWLLLSALLGGLLLNILPCVFPILSLKALALVRHGGGEATARREGLAYLAGTTLAALALGGLLLALRAGGEQVGWAFQLQEPRVVALLALLAVAITANLAGLYEFALPGFGARGTKAGETRGAFATGLLASFVATPCTGPFMAAALGAALLLPVPQALALFGALGLGLGLPFLLLGFVPPLRRALPRPGPWMARFRHWMALPMGLTALALFWLAWRMGGVTFVLGLSVFAAVTIGLLIAAGRGQTTGTTGGRGFLAAAALALGAIVATPFLLSAPASDHRSLLDAEPFSQAALAEARAGGRPVFVWMTADWCVTCKVNETRAIETTATRQAFAAAGVAVLRGDWTRRDPAITRYLTERGSAGVPLYVWYAPGRSGENLPQLLSSDSLPRLARSTEPSR